MNVENVKISTFWEGGVNFALFSRLDFCWGYHSVLLRLWHRDRRVDFLREGILYVLDFLLLYRLGLCRESERFWALSTTGT